MQEIREDASAFTATLFLPVGISDISDAARRSGLSEHAGSGFQEGNMKAAVIVAHPDDETIWSGGLILRHPDWEWTVLSLCRGDDPDRSPKFKAVCPQLRATGIISDLNDSEPLLEINPGREIGPRIVGAIGETAWDLCLTHGRNGEYGHRRHKEVHGEVVRLIEEGMLQCEELWTFAYECDTVTKPCRPASWADIFVELAEKELAEKRRIVQEEYGYGKDSFEVMACISPEVFQRVKRGAKGVEL